jgi:hypothetical protein
LAQKESVHKNFILYVCTEYIQTKVGIFRRVCSKYVLHLKSRGEAEFRKYIRLKLQKMYVHMYVCMYVCMCM